LFCFSVAGSKADLQETNKEIEVDEVFWNTRIVPILHDLEKGKKKKSSFRSKIFAVIFIFPIALIFSVHFVISVNLFRNK